MAAAITRADIAGIHAEYGKAHPYGANRLVGIVREMYNVGRQLGLVPEEMRNPSWNMVLFTATGYYEKFMTTLTVKIPEALERSIAIAARRERVTKSELVRRAMAKYVAQTGDDRTFQSAMDLAGDLIGSVRGGPVDLATNAKYMDDYGK